MARDIQEVRIELPAGGKTFVARGNVRVQLQQAPAWLVNGVGASLNVVADYLEGGGQPDRADSLKQSLYFGAGAGTRQVELGFAQWRGSTDQWGDANADDGPVSKLIELDQTIAAERVDSTRPAKLEFGDFSSDSTARYDPLTVVPGDSDLRFDATEQVSTLRASLQFVESMDLSEPIETAGRAANEYLLNPIIDGSKQPLDLPLPIDATETLSYEQLRQTVDAGVVNEGLAATLPVALEPGERVLRTVYRGAEAADLEGLLRQGVLQRDDTDRVVLERVGNQAAEFTDEYALKGGSVQRLHPATDKAFEVFLRLGEYNDPTI